MVTEEDTETCCKINYSSTISALPFYSWSRGSRGPEGQVAGELRYFLGHSLANLGFSHVLLSEILICPYYFPINLIGYHREISYMLHYSAFLSTYILFLFSKSSLGRSLRPSRHVSRN